MTLEGAERMVLQAIHDLQGESADYVDDKKIAGKTRIDLRDVRDWLETLEGKELVQRARTTQGDSAYITAKGRQALRLSAPVSGSARPSPGSTAVRDHVPGSVLHLIWDSLDAHLQDAFSLAYNKNRREGSSQIRTRDLFQALVRVDDGAMRLLIETLPEGSLPEPISSEVGMDRHLLHENPLLSSCVEDSLEHFLASGPLPRKLSPVDVFVDIGKHGDGSSVARLREYGVTPEVIETQVSSRNLAVVRRKT
jgi:hypothetical protein